MKTKGTTPGQPVRELVLAGTWGICRHGHGVELLRVRAKTKLAAMKKAGKQLGIPADQLGAVSLLPPVYRTVGVEPGSPAAG